MNLFFFSISAVNYSHDCYECGVTFLILLKFLLLPVKTAIVQIDRRSQILMSGKKEEVV